MCKLRCVSGTSAFLRSISLEAVGLGVHLAAGTHDFLVQAEYMFTSIPPPVSWPTQGKTKTNVRHNQPKDAQQGIQQVSIPRYSSSDKLFPPILMLRHMFSRRIKHVFSGPKV